MIRSPGGYTLIEALMVVAISSTIFVGVIILFAGSRDKVDFDQAKVDINTKLKSYVNQVSTGTFAGSTTHRCSLNGNPVKKRPILTFAPFGTTSGSSEKCIYLGKALLTYPGAVKIYVYDVLGLRNKHNGAADSGVPARALDEVNPEPAGETNPFRGTFEYLFVEEYDIPASLSVNYARVNGSPAHILKMYSPLDSSSSRGINLYASEFTASGADVNSNRLRNCIHEDSGVCATRLSLEATGWDLCVQNSNNSRRAKVNIKPTATGVAIKVTDGVC